MGFLEDWIIPLLVDYGLVAIFISQTLESMCIPIPSEVVVPYGGFLAAQGHVALWEVVVVAIAANLLGSTIAYMAGRYGGRALVLRYGRYVFMSEHHLDVADRWFERRGEITVFLTRMMPGIRTFISVPAGVSRMPFGRFVVYSVLGTAPWNVALAYLGWVFGENWGRLQEWLHQYNLVFFALLAVLVAAAVVWKWRDVRKRKSPRAS
ncbi:MAG TPA: DedA family protein [Thermoleophilia bacterium]|nr:DedA family protein [Thermoleophilia bacterium]